MEKINADIKANEFKPVYLLYGDEPFPEAAENFFL